MKNEKYFLTELWKAKASWQALDGPERSDYLNKNMLPLLSQIMGKGAMLIASAINENTTEEKLDYDYMAVWQLPNKALSDELEQGVKKVGFYDYFEQVNFSGSAIGPEELVGHMATQQL